MLVGLGDKQRGSPYINYVVRVLCMKKIEIKNILSF